MGGRRALTVCRDVLVALGLGLAGALLAAGVAGAQVAIANRYWEAGYLRLLVDAVLARFDLWAPAFAATALALLALAARRGRRPGRRLGAVALAVLAAIIGARLLSAADARRARPGPNLLLISIDTLRADRLGTYGHELRTSPTIDGRLAAAGVVFETVLSQSPKTTPSHMTMFTSLYPSVHGVELWKGTTPGRVLNPAVHTLAEVLKNAGYATAAFTAGAHMHRARGFDQGFDVYTHTTPLARVRRWIAANRGRTFFAFFHTFEVHDPYTPPRRLIEEFAPGYQGRVRDAVERVRAGVGGWEEAHSVFWESVDRNDPRDVQFVSRLYDAGIRRMDEATIRPLLDDLDALGLTDRTLVAFTSDHGEAFGEHGIFLHDDLYADTLHVPLILRLPGRLPAGRRVRAPARLVDVMPTVLDLLGVPAPAGVQGRSLVPAIRGESDGVAATISEYSNTAIGRRYESLRRDALSYIVDGAAEQLFDRARDPGETTNLAGREPVLLASLRGELERWREECRELGTRLGPGSESVQPGEQTLRQLRALGYVE